MPAPRDSFWLDVWKIALGVFLGSLLTALAALICGIMLGFTFQMMAAAEKPAPAKPEVVTIEEINDMIVDYKDLTRSPATELAKAKAASSVAAAFRQRRDAKNAEQWESKANRHRAAQDSWKRTGPVD